jgi:hypothetical protein
MPSLLTKGGGSTARGCAKDNEANRQYLAHCDAVVNFKADGDVISFSYDAAKIPADVPDGIWFDQTEPAF